MKYRVNLIEDILKTEKLQKERSLRITISTWLALGVLVYALVDATIRIVSINHLINQEQDKLNRLEKEYATYQATKEVVNRMDIELLNKIQQDRIFWTKKLAATALYLPEDYWIEEITYDGSYFVSGFGYTIPEQKQLITMDEYLNKLRADSTFSDNFPVVFLDAVVRTDEKDVKRVLFELSGYKTAGGLK